MSVYGCFRVCESVSLYVYKCKSVYKCEGV